jgi:hypothetical protein
MKPQQLELVIGLRFSAIAVRSLADCVDIDIILLRLLILRAVPSIHRLCPSSTHRCPAAGALIRGGNT